MVTETSSSGSKDSKARPVTTGSAAIRTTTCFAASRATTRSWAALATILYEIELSHGQDVIAEGLYVTEEIIDLNGTFNSLHYTATWTDGGYGTTAQGDRYRYMLVITRNGTGETVYSSRFGVDFITRARKPACLRQSPGRRSTISG